MILTTSITQNYETRAAPYIDSLRKHADFPCYVVGINYMPDIDGVNCLSLPRDKNGGAPSPTYSTQHGSFLNIMKQIKTDTVILHTDADFTMQRPLNDNERGMLALPHDAVLVGYNGGPHETLRTEYGRLSPNITWKNMLLEWGDWLHSKAIFNVGCIAMTKKTWRKVYKFYLSKWDLISQHLQHQARQQWLISYSLHALDLDIRIMPWSMHAHGHFGLKPGMTRRGHEVLVDGEPALFKHYL